MLLLSWLFWCHRLKSTSIHTVYNVYKVFIHCTSDLSVLFCVLNCSSWHSLPCSLMMYPVYLMVFTFHVAEWLNGHVYKSFMCKVKAVAGNCKKSNCIIRLLCICWYITLHGADSLLRHAHLNSLHFIEPKVYYCIQKNPLLVYIHFTPSHPISLRSSVTLQHWTLYI